MKNHKKILLLSLFFLQFNFIFSQSELIHENVKDYNYFSQKTFGPNGKYFFWLSLDYFFKTPNPINQQVAIQYFTSAQFNYGYKIKIKFLKIFSLGTDFHYSCEYFTFKNQFLANTNPAIFNLEKLILNNLGSEFFLRIKYDKNQNSFGIYSDFGVWGDWIFDNRHTIKLENLQNNIYQSSKQKIVNKNLSYINDYQYGAYLRIGYNKYALTIKYRLSNMFSDNFISSFSKYDMPKLSLGFHLSIPLE